MEVKGGGNASFIRLDSQRRKDSIIGYKKKSMKLSKDKIISLIIILMTLVGGVLLVLLKKDGFLKKKDTTSVSKVLLKFTEKNFKLDSSVYKKDVIINLAEFEKNENWQGTYDFDDERVWSGNYSLLLTSKDNEKTDVYLDKKEDLSKYQIFKLSLYLQTDPMDRESVRLYFGNKDKTAYYVYPLTNLVKGWNFVSIPKLKFSSVNAFSENLSVSNKKETASAGSSKNTGLFNWDKIERLGIELVSRPNSSTIINIDSLVALESQDYLEDWLFLNPLLFDLVKTTDGEISLQAKNVGGSTALIKKISGSTNFTFKAKLLPQIINARSGLFIRGDYKTNLGYYFLIDGINGSRWQIQKIGLLNASPTTIVLKNGILNNFVVEEGKPIWLKVEANGNKMKYFISTDNKSFTNLGEINDSEIKEGGVGIALFDGAITLFDEFEFTQ